MHMNLVIGLYFSVKALIQWYWWEPALSGDILPEVICDSALTNVAPAFWRIVGGTSIFCRQRNLRGRQTKLAPTVQVEFSWLSYHLQFLANSRILKLMLMCTFGGCRFGGAHLKSAGKSIRRCFFLH